jgi:mono/diheme cytochrome c family protein
MMKDYIIVLSRFFFMVMVLFLMPARDLVDSLHAREKSINDFSIRVQETKLAHILLAHGVHHVTMDRNSQFTGARSQAVSQSAIEQQAEGKEDGIAAGSGFLEESQNTPVKDVQSFDYPKGTADRGEAVYKKNCRSCHGYFAQGGGYGPKLQQNSILQDDDRFWNIVLKGKGKMPGWERSLSVQEIADVQAYLKTLKGGL